MVPAIIAVIVWLSGVREIYAVIVRSSFGNKASAITPEEVKKVRAGK